MPAKPFCSIPEQLEILSRRGLRVSASDGDILLGENYYAVINGYKAPFIDRIASSSSPEERYMGPVHDISLFDAVNLMGNILPPETIEEAHGSIRTLSQQFSQESPILTDVLSRFEFIK